MEITYYAAKNENIFNLIEKYWAILREIKKVLEMFYIVTKQLQKPDITLSETFGLWTLLKLRLEQHLSRGSHYTDFAHKLLIELESRERITLYNPIVFSAVLLDPRYRALLSSDQRKEAKLKMLQIWQKN